MKTKRTEIKELGELGLIEAIRKKSRNELPTTALGIGDDAALHQIDDRYIVISSDLLLENIHFDLSYFPLQHLGYKAVTVNVSDIAAMNGIPKQLLVNIGLSNKMSVEAIEAFYEGVNAACKNYNIDLVGGDTSSSKSGFLISISIIGETPVDTVCLRSKAKEGDIVCVTGDLGAAYVGLQILEREKQVFLANPNMQPELTKYEYVVGRQLKPQARMDIIFELRDLGIVPHAMIDISDGLASEILHIGKASNVGMKIFEEKLPIDTQTYDTAVALNLDPNTCVLNGGEDYELLFTVSQNDFQKIEKHPEIHAIGYTQAAEKGLSLHSQNDKMYPITSLGWQHF